MLITSLNEKLRGGKKIIFEREEEGRKWRIHEALIEIRTYINHHHPMISIRSKEINNMK